MPYQVLARKWRPQRFEDVVGQRAITQTLRNAIRTGRIAQAYLFAGPRGVGKTTTARILARALNCVEGPTADPCGRCDACLEIAEGRDMDVLEIDAATHTGIDNVRAVIIDGLSIPPARDRYKLFIIDEVHQLSTPSFNALLKSIEEPPPHAAFIMATTEIGKIPETILSRVQVFEFRTIPSEAIAEHLRKIAGAEKIAVSDEALALVARAADGSMRDAQTALDQVIAFAGDTITIEDVSSVLGLVGRDLLLDMLAAVANEEAAAAFALAGRAVEAGYDLKLVCREMSRVVRDLMVLSIDPSRLTDPDVAPEGERERLKELGPRFSREDLLRAFDLLTRAEYDIKNAAEPRYQLEMALLRWMHLRKLVPLGELLERLQAEPGAARSGPPSPGRNSGPPGAGGRPGAAVRTPAPSPRVPPRDAAPAPDKVTVAPRGGPDEKAPSVPPPSNDRRTSPGASPGPPFAPAPGNVRDAFLASIEQARAVFYRTVVAQAQRIETTGDTILFVFAPVHRLLKEQVEQHRAWLESLAERAAGRRMAVQSQLLAASGSEAPAPAAAASAEQPVRRAERDLRAIALGDGGVQALLGAFPAEIRVVEEIDPSRQRR
jgi:DNA polymerase-3 subunit gamma/tau